MYLANKVVNLTFQEAKSYFLDKNWTLNMIQKSAPSNCFPSFVSSISG